MFSVIIQRLLLIVVMRLNRQTQDAVYVFAVGVVHDLEEETARTGESRSAASSTLSNRDWIDLLAILLFLVLILVSRSLRCSLSYGFMVMILCLIFSTNTFPLFSIIYFARLGHALYTGQWDLDHLRWYDVWLVIPSCISELCRAAWKLFFE